MEFTETFNRHLFILLIVYLILFNPFMMMLVVLMFGTRQGPRAPQHLPEPGEP